MSSITLRNKFVVNDEGRGLTKDALRAKINAVTNHATNNLTEAVENLANGYKELNPVPSEYQQVEWIANEGRSYIDTGYYPSSYEKVRIKFSFYAAGDAGSTANQIMGSANGTSGAPGYIIGCSLNTDKTGGTYWIRMHTTTASANPGVSFDADGTPHEFEISTDDIIYDGKSCGWSVAPTLTTTDLNNPFYIFVGHIIQGKYIRLLVILILSEYMSVKYVEAP